MIIIKLIGGLGNQMFEYAVAYVAAKHNKTELKIDSLYYRDKSKRLHRFEYRPYALDLFNISATCASSKEINRFLLPRIFNKYIYYILKRFHKQWHIFTEKDITSYKKLINLPYKDIYLNGLFQSYNFIKNDIDDLKKEFTFKEKLPDTHTDISAKIESSEESVCVVFRRGDYVNHPFLDVVTLDFYYKAIEILKEKILTKLSIFVFSEDIE